MYTYLIYGLIIYSEFPLYQLEQYNSSKVDVTIRLGAVGEDISDAIRRGINSVMSKDRLWFRNDVGIFVMSDGNDIFIQPEDTATDYDLASFVLGWCISFIFQQRGVLAIHCSALEMQNQAVLISGVSGVGKSTLALTLLQKGYRYLADDIAMVDLSNDLMLAPAFPQQKVCRNVAETMQEDSLFYINEKKDKFAYINNGDFCPEPRKLTTMFLLEKYGGDELIFEKTTGLAMWNGIINNLFLLDAYRALDFPSGELERCLALADQLDMYTIKRPEGNDTVEEICSHIETIMKTKA